MKAISPVRSLRSCYEAVCCISDQSLSISRSPSEEPVEALSDMNDCYSRLKELVPSIPQNKSVSQIEILQHVIDYIFDLEIVLESPAGAPDKLMELKSSEIKHSLSKESERALRAPQVFYSHRCRTETSPLIDKSGRE